MAGEWKRVCLAEVVDIISGGTPKTTVPEYWGGDIPWLSVSDFNTGYRWVSSAEKHITKRGLSESATTLLNQGDIIISARGTVGALAQLDKPMAFNQSCYGLRGKNDIADTNFIYYALRQLVVDMKQVAHGGVFDTITRDTFRIIECDLPPLSEQRAIAHILGTLDDKIELNRKQSETLEAMARALFKAWFVDFEPVRAKMEGRWQRGQSLPGLPAHLYDLFPDRLVDSELGEIPEGWGMGPLNHFFSVGLGGAWGEDEPSAQATVAVRCLRGIDCHDLAEGRIPDVPVRRLSPKQVANRELTEGTILIEGSGSFCGRSMIWVRGYEALFGAPVGYSNFCKRLDPRCTAAQAAICWMQIRQAYQDGILQSFRTGTAFPNFDVHGALSNLVVVVPPVPLAEVFGKMFAMSNRLDLMAQSRTLAHLRDALLPKLISGEIRMKDAERFLEERGL